MLLEEYLLPCFSKTFFGFECLGCGLQRAFIFFINGEFWSAFKMYPAIFSMFALAIFLLVNLKIKYKNSQKIISILAYLNVSIMIINYIIKTTL